MHIEKNESPLRLEGGVMKSGVKNGLTMVTFIQINIIDFEHSNLCVSELEQNRFMFRISKYQECWKNHTF